MKEILFHLNSLVQIGCSCDDCTCDDRLDQLIDLVISIAERLNEKETN